MSFKALIFDFDGIITDTEPIHMEAWLDVLEPLGIEFDEDEYRAHYLGLNDRDFLDAVCRIHKVHLADNEKADLIEQKAIESISLLEKDVPLIPGVSEFVEEVRNRSMLAICSGANRGEIEFILRRIKWTELFNPIVASDSVKKGKPDPEGYIRALEGLGERSKRPLFAADVIAIEDSPKGVAAAKAAGLRCIAVGSSFSRLELCQADLIVDSITDVDISQL